MTINVTHKEISEKPQDDEVVLSVQGVSKKFCRDLKRSLLYGVQDIASELVGTREKSERLRPKEFWALKDVSFQLRRGEALGLVGPNGSGKTTLLRIISGLIKPDVGCLEVKGRLAPLIALGAGFNPILTGRENIYANMSILGLSKKEIDERFQDVVEFAEIGDAIDAPVQSYSSGMAARLGFSCAVHTEPDILLIDEVLAVGDVMFRLKCVRKLSELRHKGISFIMVSHNHDALATICEYAVYLLKGISIIFSDIRSVMDKYEHDLFIGSQNIIGKMHIQKKPEGDSSGLDITSINFQNTEGIGSSSLVSGKSACLAIVCRVKKHFSRVNVNIQVEELSGEGGMILYIISSDDGVLLDLSPGEQEIQMYIPCLVLGAGTYTMRMLIRKDYGDYLDRVDSFRFSVEKEDGTSYSRFYQPRSWKIFHN